MAEEDIFDDTDSGAVEHSLRGPSGAHRWRRCAGSINAERGLVEKPRFEAAQGTVFHEYAAMCLEHGLEPENFPLGVVHVIDGLKVVFDEDMQRYMRNGLELVRGWIEPGDIVIIERKVSTEPWCGPKEFGSCDCAIIKVRARQIISFDWKYGGDPVSPIKNDQSYLYVLGVWNDYAEAIFKRPDDIEVIIHIEQPRAPAGGGTWQTTMVEVLAEGEQIREDALETMNPNAARTPGEKQCKFCKASGRCKEEQDYLLDVFQQSYEEIEENLSYGVDIPPAFNDPHSLTAQARSYMLLHKKHFEKYLKRVHAIIMADFMSGKEVPLIKAIEGNAGKRTYREEYLPEIKNKLVDVIPEDKLFIKTMLSPAQAEKEIGKKKFKELVGAYIYQPPGKPILVSINHKSPAIEDFASMYEDLEDEEEDDGD